MTAPDPVALRDAASAIARAAGELLRARFRTRAAEGLAVRGERDPVTAADRDSEALIVAAIREAFPGHAILGEEGGVRPDRPPAGTVWIVDPLDGTVNFLHGHPFYAVSIAVWHDGAPLAGVVHAPSLGEHFAAARGHGATLNGARIAVNDTPRLLDAILATGFPYDRSHVRQNNLAQADALTLAARGVRRNGAAAIDLAYVAAGIYGGFWEYWLSPWDVAAGGLLVLEAGGRVTDVAGVEAPAAWGFGRNVLASNARLHAAIAAHLESFRGE